MSCTTVVVDVSVLVHRMHNLLNPIDHTNPHWKGLIKAQLSYVASGDWLGELKPEKFQVIWVTDSKPYWRSDYLLNPEVLSKTQRSTKKLESLRARLNELMTSGVDLENPEYLKLIESLSIHYKAGRSLPVYSFTKMRDYTYKVITEAKWTMLAKKGYEADDCAAAVVQVNSELSDNQRNRIILLTIDSDWMGLVSEDVMWYCMTGFYPRVRSDLFSCNVWANKRLGVNLKSFKDLWVIKGDQGDKSDNLPASNGTLLPVIDLLNPPDEHKLWLHPMGSFIRDTLVSPRIMPVNSEKAVDYIGRNGISLPIRPFNSLSDLARVP
jgi:5'-3' exonuclease, N-terminal resolvase-like domain